MRSKLGLDDVITDNAIHLTNKGDAHHFHSFLYHTPMGKKLSIKCIFASITPKWFCSSDFSHWMLDILSLKRNYPVDVHIQRTIDTKQHSFGVKVVSGDGDAVGADGSRSRSQSHYLDQIQFWQYSRPRCSTSLLSGERQGVLRELSKATVWRFEHSDIKFSLIA